MNYHSHFIFIICLFLENSFLIMMTMIMILNTYITFVNFFVMDQIFIWIIFHISTHLIQQSYEESVFIILSLPFLFKDEDATNTLRHFFVFLMLSGSRVCMLTTMLYCVSEAKYHHFIKRCYRCKKNNQQIRKSYCSIFAGKLNRFTR